MGFLTVDDVLARDPLQQVVKVLRMW